MKQYIVSGVVDKVEPVHDHLTFVSFHVIGKGGVRERRAFYSALDRAYVDVGTVIDFIETYSGWGPWKKLQQEIRSTRYTGSSGEWSQSQINAITQDFRRKEGKEYPKLDAF